jgi:DNA integrity scanning protein DisA with diadenylate cyclase activity
VIATSPSLTEVEAVTDYHPSTSVPIESFGTRHRSAFRFCSSLEDSASFVVSQDGGVKAIKRVGDKVNLWPDINTGFMGI